MAASATAVQEEIVQSDPNALARSRHMDATMAQINGLFGPGAPARLGNTVAAGAANTGPGQSPGPGAPAPTHRTGLMASMAQRDKQNAQPEHGNDDGGAGSLIMGSMLGGGVLGHMVEAMHVVEGKEEVQGKARSNAGAMVEGLDGKPRLDGVSAGVEAPKAARSPFQQESRFSFGPPRR